MESLEEKLTAYREAPPADSRPEASNFPQHQYTMSADRSLFHAPATYPKPPSNMWYEVPKTPVGDRPKPIFPWEENQAKPTRVFAEDIVSDPEPSIVSTDEDTQPDSGVVTPTIQVTSPEPFASYSRTNAWDEIPEIERYMNSLQARRAKVQILYQASQTPTSRGTDLPQPRRSSMILTDFPTEIERPSLPVTPAPVRRPSFWGEDHDSLGHMPAAEGVPRQEDWDPMAKLAELQQHQSGVLAQSSISPTRTIPNRTLPASAAPLPEKALFSPTAEETDAPMTTVVPLPLLPSGSEGSLARDAGNGQADLDLGGATSVSGTKERELDLSRGGGEHSGVDEGVFGPVE